MATEQQTTPRGREHHGRQSAPQKKQAPISEAKLDIPTRKKLFRLWFPTESPHDGQLATVRQIALSWSLLKWRHLIPAEAFEGKDFEYEQPGLTLGMLHAKKEGAWLFHVEYLDPRGTTPRIWATDVIVQDREDERWFGVMVDCWAFPSDNVLTSPPALTRHIVEAFDLLDVDLPVDNAPWLIDFDEDADELLDFLIEPHRRLPILVIPGTSDSHGPVYAIDADLFAERLQGLAHVVQLPQTYARDVNDSLGDALAPTGAARLYYPGLSRKDKTESHPVFTVDDIYNTAYQETKGVTVFIKQLASKLALYSTREQVLYEEVPIPTYSQVRKYILGQGGPLDENGHPTESPLFTMLR